MPCAGAVPHLNELNEKYGEKGLSVLGVTDEDKRDTEDFIQKKGVKYAYAYDKAGKLMGRLGVSGIPHAFLVDAQGKIVWDGHPGELTDAIITKALGGSLPKPLFDFPSGAAAVRSALSKHNYATAMAEAEKLPEGQGGADLKKALQGMISGRVATMQSALKAGDFLTAVDMGTALKKDLAGLPEAPEADKVLEQVKGNKEAEPVLAAQKKIRTIAEQKLGKKTDFERAMGDLKKIAADLKGTFAAKEAEDTSAMLTKRRQQSR